MKEALKEVMVWNGVEGLGEIQGHDGGAGRGFTLVKPPGYCFGDGKKGGGSGPSRPEAMLRLRKGQVRLKKREQEPLEDLDCGREE